MDREVIEGESDQVVALNVAILALSRNSIRRLLVLDA
jgi:hypothetical protein